VALRIGEPTLLLSSPDDIQHVFLKNAAGYSKSPRQLEAFGPIVLAAADRFVAECAGKGRVELRDEMERLARSVIVEALFGPGVDDTDLTWAIEIEAFRRSRRFTAIASRYPPQRVVGSIRSRGRMTIARGDRTNRRAFEGAHRGAGADRRGAFGPAARASDHAGGG
jgi:hypothetical protein